MTCVDWDYSTLPDACAGGVETALPSRYRTSMCCSRYGLARSPALPMDGTFPAHHIHEAVDFLSSSSRGVVIVEFQIITSRLLQATACVRRRILHRSLKLVR